MVVEVPRDEARDRAINSDAGQRVIGTKSVKKSPARGRGQGRREGEFQAVSGGGEAESMP